MPEGSCFPRPKYRKNAVPSETGSRAMSDSFQNPPSRTVSIGIPMVELKPLEFCRFPLQQLVVSLVQLLAPKASKSSFVLLLSLLLPLKMESFHKLPREGNKNLFVHKWLTQRQAHLLRVEQGIPILEHGVLVDMSWVPDWAFEVADQEMSHGERWCFIPIQNILDTSSGNLMEKMHAKRSRGNTHSESSQVQVEGRKIKRNAAKYSEGRNWERRRENRRRRWKLGEYDSRDRFYPR